MDGLGIVSSKVFIGLGSTVRTGHEQECASLVCHRDISIHNTIPVLMSIKESKAIDTNLEPPHSPTSPWLGSLDILKHLLGRPLSTLDLQVIITG